MSGSGRFYMSAPSLQNRWAFLFIDTVARGVCVCVCVCVCVYVCVRERERESEWVTVTNTGVKTFFICMKIALPNCQHFKAMSTRTKPIFFYSRLPWHCFKSICVQMDPLLTTQHAWRGAWNSPKTERKLSMRVKLSRCILSDSRHLKWWGVCGCP